VVAIPADQQLDAVCDQRDELLREDLRLGSSTGAKMLDLLVKRLGRGLVSDQANRTTVFACETREMAEHTLQLGPSRAVPTHMVGSRSGRPPVIESLYPRSVADMYLIVDQTTPLLLAQQ
jgi:hypothetical protein